MSFLAFLRDNARWLAGGLLLTFFSSFGQTFFISLSAGDIRREYALSHGAFGTVYMIATLASALTLPRLGQIVDRYSVRQVTLFVVPMLAAAAVMMALSHHIAVLLVTIYLLRLFGQGMMVHNAYTAAARWFSAQRGRALSTIILGHNAGDAVMPICFVAITAAVGWRNAWLLAAASSSWSRCRSSPCWSASTVSRAPPIPFRASSMRATGPVPKCCATRFSTLPRSASWRLPSS